MLNPYFRFFALWTSMYGCWLAASASPLPCCLDIHLWLPVSPLCGHGRSILWTHPRCMCIRTIRGYISGWRQSLKYPRLEAKLSIQRITGDTGTGNTAEKTKQWVLTTTELSRLAKLSRNGKVYVAAASPQTPVGDKALKVPLGRSLRRLDASPVGSKAFHTAERPYNGPA